MAINVNRNSINFIPMPSTQMAIGERPVYIYGLQDPRDEQIKYIGKALNPNKRYNKHLSSECLRQACPKSSWIISLKNKGFKPKLEILDEVPESEWAFWEEWWMSLFRSWNFKLKNLKSGGIGGVPSLATREKMRAARIGKSASIETRDKMRLKAISLKSADRLQIANSILLLDKDWCKKRGGKIHEARKKNGRYGMTDDGKRRISVATKGRKRSAESLESFRQTFRNKSRYILKHTKDGIFIEEVKLYDAIREFGVSIYNALKNSRLSGGFKWTEKTNYEL